MLLDLIKGGGAVQGDGIETLSFRLGAFYARLYVYFSFSFFARIVLEIYQFRCIIIGEFANNCQAITNLHIFII